MTHVKHDSQKLRLFTRGLLEVYRLGVYGAEKYGDPQNWALVETPQRYVEAAIRHLFARLDGEVRDKESGGYHLAAAAWSLLVLVELECAGRLNELAAPIPACPESNSSSLNSNSALRR